LGPTRHVWLAGNPELLQSHEGALIDFLRDVGGIDSSIEAVCGDGRADEM
jgi:hypothetical protein